MQRVDLFCGDLQALHCWCRLADPHLTGSDLNDITFMQERAFYVFPI